MQENNLQSNMVASNRISVVKFGLDNSCEESGESPYQIFRHVGDDFYELGRDYTLIGWCDSNGLSIRPSDGDYAIMLQRTDGVEFWIHCPSTTECDGCAPYGPYAEQYHPGYTHTF